MNKYTRAIALSRGEYSDYQVLAFFEDEETANKWKEAMSENAEGYYGNPEIEFFPIIKVGTEPHKVTTFFKHAELWDNGQVSEIREWSVTDWPITTLYGHPPNRARVRYVRAPCHHNKGGRLEVVGNSAEVVAKVANEKIAMWKAGAWGGPKHEEILEEA